MTTWWRDIPLVARSLMTIRFLRSISQGALAVDFVLYLHAMHWSAAAIGLLLMASGLTGALLSIVVGLISDQYGRKPFLLFYEGGLVLGTLLIVFTHLRIVLIVVAIFFAFGRGANGSSGPFAPAEQAWLASVIPPLRRGSLFSVNAALTFWGMAIGSFLAGVLPGFLTGTQPVVRFDPLFWLTIVIGVINAVQIWWTPEPKAQATEPVAENVSSIDETTLRHQENKALSLLALVNTINSLGVGLIAPLLPYWFSVRFGVGPKAIGPVYGLTFLLTGLSSLAIGKVSQRIGLMGSIVWPRFIGVIALISMAFMPSFLPAAILYILRSVVNRGSMGTRQAFSVSLVRDKRRGFASSLNAVSWTVPASIGPAIGGWLMGMGSLDWPFVLASALQLGYIVIFPRVMGQYDPTRGLSKSPLT
ncbi:MFS transporter [Sulfobacillus thermosulfidooxidans]|uniref:MFS transporter n=1 Tax=Sulfobacillus thermosulfidooxidans TaxID=28034 RepID=UPI00040CF1C6|nr:MFS transporter [Sulfobacillus thermosulfidooxidans]